MSERETPTTTAGLPINQSTQTKQNNTYPHFSSGFPLGSGRNLFGSFFFLEEIHVSLVQSWRETESATLQSKVFDIGSWKRVASKVSQDLRNRSVVSIKFVDSNSAVLLLNWYYEHERET